MMSNGQQCSDLPPLYRRIIFIQCPIFKVVNTLTEVYFKNKNIELFNKMHALLSPHDSFRPCWGHGCVKPQLKKARLALGDSKTPSTALNLHIIAHKHALWSEIARWQNTQCVIHRNMNKCRNGEGSHLQNKGAAKQQENIRSVRFGWLQENEGMVLLHLLLIMVP